MSAVLAAAGGTLPPPVVEVFTRPEVITAMVGVVVAVCGAVAAGFVALGKSLGRRVDAVHEQVANTHTVNLRDDLDAFREEMRAEFRRQDEERARQDRKLDRSLGEVRRDIAQVRDAQQHTDEQADMEHARLWRAIDKH